MSDKDKQEMQSMILVCIIIFLIAAFAYNNSHPGDDRDCTCVASCS